jgi:hypothetical protein
MCLREKIGPDPRNFNQRVSLGRNDLLIRTFPKDGVRTRVVYQPATGKIVIAFPDNGSMPSSYKNIK